MNTVRSLHHHKSILCFRQFYIDILFNTPHFHITAWHSVKKDWRYSIGTHLDFFRRMYFDWQPIIFEFAVNHMGELDLFVEDCQTACFSEADNCINY